MKPATYKETVEIVVAWVAGEMKALLARRCMTYHCAMMRITRFRREHPKEYKRLIKC